MGGTGLALDLYAPDGRLLDRFPLAESGRFDVSKEPIGPLVWVVRAGGRPLKSGKVVR